MYSSMGLLATLYLRVSLGIDKGVSMGKRGSFPFLACLLGTRVFPVFMGGLRYCLVLWGNS